MDRDIRGAFGPGGPRCPCCHNPGRGVVRATRRRVRQLAVEEGVEEIFESRSGPVRGLDGLFVKRVLRVSA